MYCSHCGNVLEEHFRYCSRCGTATASSMPREGYELSRPLEGRKLAGVCAGFARYLDVDVTLVRILWVLLVIFPPVPGIVAYIVCWIVMPNDPPRAVAQECSQPVA
jgi:phage shock protein C